MPIRPSSIGCRKCAGVATVAILGFGLFLGCGQRSQWKRVPLEGTATLDGQAFVGSIVFRPQSGTSGPSATAHVADGKFAFDSSTGPTSGPHVAFLMPKKTSRDQESVSTEVDIPASDPYRIEVVVQSVKEPLTGSRPGPAGGPNERADK